MSDRTIPDAAPAQARAPLGRSTLVAVLASAVLVPLALHAGFGRQHLNLADEGYLWYGVLRVLAGEVPVRDFQSYDPGRYHWCALLAPLTGDGIVGVRAAVAAYAVLGLAAGLAVLARVVRQPLALGAAGILLGLWLFPRHKLFEPATALVLAWVTVRLLEAPTVRRHLVTGLVVGLSGYVGRNHALYGGVASAAALALSLWRDPAGASAFRRVTAWAAGLVLGTAPFVLLMLLAPGFAGSLVASLGFFLERGVNLTRPWPWPWELSLGGLSPFETWRAGSETAAFLLPILAVPALAWSLLRARRADWRARAPVNGAALVGVVYLHHASVRSDVFHLAQALPPLLIALLALPLAARARLASVATWSALFLLTAAVAATWNQTLTSTLYGRQLSERTVAGERLLLSPAQAAYLPAVEQTLTARVGEGPLFIAPNRPSLYCLLRKRAPTWWIYYLWKVSAEEQHETIALLRQRGVDWALIVDAPVEDRADLLFRSMCELVWAHFEAEWERVPTPELPPDHLLLRRR